MVYLSEEIISDNENNDEKSSSELDEEVKKLLYDKSRNENINDYEVNNNKNSIKPNRKKNNKKIYISFNDIITKSNNKKRQFNPRLPIPYIT
jgi:hypothetical protein